jgi:hypothetical protein
MRKLALISGLSFISLAISPLSAVAPASAQSTSQDSAPENAELAPADEYFGRSRLSILGMRNSIKDISARIYSASQDDLSALYHKLTIVEDAVLDLKDQYPEDTWLPQLGLSLAQAFLRIPFHTAQIHANDALDWVIADYPRTDQAFYADSIRRSRLQVVTAEDIPVQPTLPSYAIP